MYENFVFNICEKCRARSELCEENEFPCAIKWSSTYDEIINIIDNEKKDTMKKICEVFER